MKKELRVFLCALALVLAVMLWPQGPALPPGLTFAQGSPTVGVLPDSGTVIPSSCNMPQIFFQTGSSGSGAGLYVCNASGVFVLLGSTAAGAQTNSFAGAASTPALTLTGAPFTGGSGTTTVPLFYLNSGTAPTTWATTGTAIGVNLPNGSTANFIDFHVNGGSSLFNVSSTGAITSAQSLSLASTGSVGFNGRGFYFFPASGVAQITNSGVSGLTRLDLGLNTSSGPALCISATLITTCAGDGSAGGFLKTPQTLQITSADVTCGTGGTISSCVAMQTITGLSVALPLTAANWSFSCDLIVSQATLAVANQIGVQTATNGATNLAASGFVPGAAGVITSGAITGVASTTTAQSVVTFTLSGTGTKVPLHLSGTIEGVSASGTTLNITVLTGAAADLLTIYRGSSCYVS